MYKAFYYDLPKSVQSIFIRTGDIHQYGTRRKHDFHLQRPKSDLYKKTVGFKGIKVWNFARHKTEIDCSLSCFKNKLKNVYLDLD